MTQASSLTLMAPHDLPQTSIVLPLPKLSDDVSATDSIQVKESMNNTVWTYVKRTDRRKFNFTFELTHEKEEEFRRFFEVYVAKNIRMFHWDGTLWIVNFASPIFDSTTVAVNEYKDLTIELEGSKL